MYRVHHFASSAEAYDASLDEGPVRENDVLVIAAEGIVGLASTYPIAVTIASGALNAFPAMTRKVLLAELVHDAETIGRAVYEALRHRLSVSDQFLSFAGLKLLLSTSEPPPISTPDAITASIGEIDRPIDVVRKRRAGLEPGSGEALVLGQALDQLTNARALLRQSQGSLDSLGRAGGRGRGQADAGDGPAHARKDLPCSPPRSPPASRPKPSPRSDGCSTAPRTTS